MGARVYRDNLNTRTFIVRFLNYWSDGQIILDKKVWTNITESTSLETWNRHLTRKQLETHGAYSAL